MPYFQGEDTKGPGHYKSPICPLMAILRLLETADTDCNTHSVDCIKDECMFFRTKSYPVAGNVFEPQTVKLEQTGWCGLVGMPDEFKSTLKLYKGYSIPTDCCAKEEISNPLKEKKTFKSSEIQDEKI